MLLSSGLPELSQTSYVFVEAIFFVRNITITWVKLLFNVSQ